MIIGLHSADICINGKKGRKDKTANEAYPSSHYNIPNCHAEEK